MLRSVYDKYLSILISFAVHELQWIFYHQQFTLFVKSKTED